MALKALKYISYNIDEAECLTIIGKLQPIEENGTNIVPCIEEEEEETASLPRRIIDFSQHAKIEYWTQLGESKQKTKFTTFYFYPIKSAKETEAIRELFAKHL